MHLMIDEQRFWERLGFKQTILCSGNLGWSYPPEYSLERGFLPDINSLDALFKHATPVVKERLGSKEYYKLLLRWVREIPYGDEDPAQALALAIDKVDVN